MIAAVEPSTCLRAARALDQRADPDPEQRHAGADHDRGGDLEHEPPGLARGALELRFGAGRRSCPGKVAGPAGAKLLGDARFASRDRRCPPGPFLRRRPGPLRAGGGAAARRARRAGDRRRLADRPRARQGSRAPGVEVLLDGDGVDARRAGRAAWSRARACPASAPAIVAARERGLPVIGELELAWRLLPNRFCAVTGTNGKTTVAELLGHVWRDGRRAGRGRRQRRHARSPRWSARSTPRRRSSARRRASSSRTPTRSRPSAGCCSTSPPTTSTATATLERLPGRRSCGIFANQGDDDVCVYNGSTRARRARPRRLRRRVAFCASRGRRRLPAVSRRAIELWGEPWSSSRARLLGPHNAENAAAAAAPRGALGIEREAIADGLRSFAGVPHRLERVAEVDGVALRQRLEGDQRRRGARGAALVRRRRARDPRRLAQGRRLRRARRAGRRALRRAAI